MDVEEATIATLQRAMESGQLTSRRLVETCIARIEALDWSGPTLRSVLEVNPDALAIADALDAERAAGGPRGPLHGIPLLLKDNIDTADGMHTTAGSLALLGSRPGQDATVAHRLREAGAVLLGKTNLSEWANFRSTRSSSGWSGRGRQTRNPYALDRNPGGSSSGSAVAVAANLTVAALGTETVGSIVGPSSMCGVVGIKPTVGLTSRAGVIPISRTQDTVGVHARTVADAATVLGALTGVDPRDEATQHSSGRSHHDYTQHLQADGLPGARIGVARKFHTGYSEHTDAIFEAALQVLRAQGAVLIDDVEFPGEADLRAPLPGPDLTTQGIVLQYEFKAGVNQYLATRPDAGVDTLADLIRFNLEHAAEEMPYFAQEIFLASQARGPLTDELYLQALAKNRAFRSAFEQFLDEQRFDALVAPTTGPAWMIDVINGDRRLGGSAQPAAVAGFPLVTVPAGFAFEQLPVGISFMGRAWSEPRLIQLAYAFEQAQPVRRRPECLPTVPLP